MNEFEQQPPALRTVGAEGLRSSAAARRRHADQPRRRAGRRPPGGHRPRPPDKLALVRGRARQGVSLSQALVDEGVATSEGIARALATRFQLPLVDLALNGRRRRRRAEVPLHVLERIVAIPYLLDDGTLRSRSPTRRTSTRSTSSGSRRASRSRSASPSARTSRPRSPARRAVGGLRRPRPGRGGARRRGRGGGGRRPRGRRRHLRRAARPPRQLGHLPGRRGRRLGHPLRAAGGRARRAVPDRRRTPGGAADPEADDARASRLA